MTPAEAYHKGFLDCLQAYAWWKNGDQFVGKQEEKYVGCGTQNLQEAIRYARENHYYRPPKLVEEDFKDRRKACK